MEVRVCQPRVLLVGSKSAGMGAFPSATQLSADLSLLAEAMATVQEALDQISDKGCSAVVCWAERENELAGVIRIRKANPEVPILLLTPEVDPVFHTLARQLGATRILLPESDPERTAERIRTAVLSGDLLGELRARAAEARSHAKDLLELVKENRELTETARSRVRKSLRLTFVPLVIEGDSDSALRTVRALQKADVFAPIPVLRNREEAIAYLSNLGTPGTPGLQVQPSILLLDGDLPNESSLEILKWVRSTPALAQIPVILFSSSADPARISQAYELGANSYVLKRADFESQVQCVASLKTYWGSFNQGPNPF